MHGIARREIRHNLASRRRRGIKIIIIEIKRSSSDGSHLAMAFSLIKRKLMRKTSKYCPASGRSTSACVLTAHQHRSIIIISIVFASHQKNSFQRGAAMMAWRNAASALASISASLSKARISITPAGASCGGVLI